jgi:putative transposase
VKYRLIDEHTEAFDVADLCGAFEVERSAYYAWRKAGPSARKQEDTEIKAEIKVIQKKSKGREGHRPCQHHLRDRGVQCGRDRTLRLMKELGISGTQQKGFKPVGTDSNHQYGYSPNLLKEHGKPAQCNEIWVTDTTYLKTAEGWMYLATVMDLFSRRIIGWSLSERNDTALVLKALNAAVLTRGGCVRGTIHHSDRGSTYASHAYQLRLNAHGLKPSMSAKGNCYDNAAMESFYGRFKCSSIRNRIFDGSEELRQHVFDYIEIFYNRFRKHSALGYQAPSAFEENFIPPAGGMNKRVA